MAKHTLKSEGGSFHGTTIVATPRQLTELFPDSYYDGNDGTDKTNFDFSLETDDGDFFTIYDWKEYRVLDMDEKVEWHIGGDNGVITEKAKRELLKQLKK